eukprot:comp52933_c0_seq1/m.47718 comp52933_c0_seq1/g.47718  ORF comp52933_c0_seq1/g.47718 comp52933_c0_seq1/m.47718 type:complete len:291 (-) comp52933_c0_seq1:12-884(-)
MEQVIGTRPAMLPMKAHSATVPHSSTNTGATFYFQEHEFCCTLPHSHVNQTAPTVHLSFDISTIKGKVIGFALTIVGGKHVVVAAVRRTAPAHKAGLRLGDEIAEINERPVAGMELRDIYSLLSSQSHVTLCVHKQPFSRTLNLCPVTGSITFDDLLSATGTENGASAHSDISDDRPSCKTLPSRPMCTGSVTFRERVRAFLFPYSRNSVALNLENGRVVGTDFVVLCVSGKSVLGRIDEEILDCLRRKVAKSRADMRPIVIKIMHADAYADIASNERVALYLRRFEEAI